MGSRETLLLPTFFVLLSLTTTAAASVHLPEDRAHGFLFRPVDNEVTISAPVFSYEFVPRRKLLRIHDVDLTPASLDAKEVEENGSRILVIRYPGTFFEPDQVSFLAKGEKIAGTVSQIKEAQLSRENGLPTGEIRWPLPSFLGGGAWAKRKLCLRQSFDQQFTELCRRPESWRSRGAQINSLKINGKHVPAENGESHFIIDGMVEIEARLDAVFELSIKARPYENRFVDIVKTPAGYEISGYGRAPLGGREVYRGRHVRGLARTERQFGLYGDPADFWISSWPWTERWLRISSPVGGIYGHTVNFVDLPPGESRPLRRENNWTETYLSTLEVPLIERGTSTVWTLPLEEKGGSRFYRREVVDGERKWKSSLRLFRGFSRELSGRLTGVNVGSSSSLLIFGDVTYNEWFERAFGLIDSETWRQRTGFSVKYFQLLHTIQMSSAPRQDLGLRVLTLDLKYRFNPGLWGRNETTGLMLASQKIWSLLDSVDTYGVGFFWARSLPDLFDRIMNMIPYLEYPKWVDMELFYYPVSSRSDVKLGPTYSLNFHGKVMWTDQIYGEAGFGLRRYDLRSIELGSLTLTTLYGTMGMGVNF